jgi:hypothetical protein
MDASRQGRFVSLRFNALESRLLRTVFAEIIEHYRLKPDQIDPKLAAVWYYTRGCQSAGLSEDETRDWLEALRSYKIAHLRLLEECLASIRQPKDGVYQVRVDANQAATLITVLNDHRLLAAAKHDVGQAEMDAHSIDDFSRLRSDQQAALCAIHFLASVIEELIRLIAPEAAHWADAP